MRLENRGRIAVLVGALIIAACGEEIPSRELPEWAEHLPLDARPRGDAVHAHVHLPVRASEAVELHDRGSWVSVRVALAGARPVSGVASGSMRFYPAALGDDVDYVLVERPDGFEDFVRYAQRPAEESVRFTLDVSAVAGLRLVGDVLELLDESGTPRLRARPPYLIDASGRRFPARVDLEGCDADRDARAPWGRPVVPPGAESCTLVVRWGESFGGAVVYPAVLDPWMTTGSMVLPRFGHTATLLADGRVLVVGHDDQEVNVAELYDPASETWAVTGAVREQRRDHTATRLADGRVLVAGGQHPVYEKFYGGAEIYDPAAGLFTDAGKMSSPRLLHAATLLADGRVLVAGGAEYAILFGDKVFAAAYLATSETYDPVSGSWALGPPIGAAHTFATLTALADGGALLVGGDLSTLAERYDAAADSWQPWGAFASLRAHHEALTLSDGSIAFVGGASAEVGILTTEIFDPSAPASSAWAEGATTQVGHRGGAAARLDADRLLLVGGDLVGDAEIHDPSTDAWLLVEPVSSNALVGASATSLDGQTVLVAGGATPSGTTAEAWLFTLLANAASCAHDGECASAHCADGVCCDAACSEACQACTARKKGSGDDGSCGPVTDGSADPHGICADEGGCGQTGTCSSGACAFYGNDTACSAAVCPAAGAHCDGRGACSCATPICSDDGTHFGAVDCAPYRCGAEGCLTSCTSSEECAGGHLCDRNGRCTPPSAEPVDEGGCSTGPGRAPLSALWLLACLVLMARARRRAFALTLLALLFAPLLGCSDSEEPPAPAGTGAAAGSGGVGPNATVSTGGQAGSGASGGGGSGGAGGAGGEAQPVWSCDANSYGTNDGCDCGCGIVDPDCADATGASCENCFVPGSCAASVVCPANVDPLNNAICLPPVCGNKRLDTAESCDDGNTLRGDGCDPLCHLEAPPPAWTCYDILWGPSNGCNCGCGIRDIACFDSSIESCTNNCSNNLFYSCAANPPCSASVDPSDNAVCTSCGDGIDGVNEGCDDANTVPGDGCGANCYSYPPNQWTCHPSYWKAQDGCDCGCGVVDPDCADASAASCDFCNDIGSCGTSLACPADIDAANNATCASCGNNIVDAGEACDDGNTVGDDGCGANCQKQPPPQWICDPAFYQAMDGCDCGCGAIDPDCVDATAASCVYCHDAGACGTGICPANIDPLNNAICAPPACGNGVRDEAEQCDDGNTTDADGCSASCKLEWSCSLFAYNDGHLCDCGCGSIDPDCNDATGASCDTCNRAGSCSTGLCPGNVDPANNATCVGCGNGMPDPNEQCDDANNVPGDGCTANCMLENAPVWTCLSFMYGTNDGCDCGCGIPDPDCPDANATSCNSCNAPGSCGNGPCPATNIDPLNNAVCIWTCSFLYYGTNDGCDCGCGIPDPDCTDTTVGSCLYCDDPGSCSTGICPANIDPTNNAVCL